jgi:ATP-binding cassette subfamily B protein
MTRFLYRNLHGRRAVVAFAVGLTVVGVGADILSAFPLKFILDKIVHHLDPGVSFLGPLIGFFDQFGTRNGLTDREIHTQLGVILFSGALLLFLGIAGSLVAFVQLATAAHVAQDVGARLRKRLFVHIEHLSLAWHGRQRTGDLVQRITGNVTDIEKLITDGLVDLLSGILALIGFLVVMLLLNWQFTMLSLIILPPLAVVIVSYTHSIKRASRKAAKALGEVAEVATEGVGAIAEIKAFTLERWLANTFFGRVDRKRAFAWRAGRRDAEFDPFVLTLVTLSSVAIITVGAWIAFGHGHRYTAWFLTIPAGSITVGTLTVFLSYSRQLYSPLRSLSKLWLLIATGTSAAERIQEVLDQPREEPPSTTGKSDVTANIRGSVVYRGVVFGYEEGRPVLHGIDLDVPVGSRMALVGLTGSGKTTLVRLLPRLYEPWAGTITVDGVDIREYPRDVLRSNMSIVLQDSILFAGTIRENIVLNTADVTDEQLIRATSLAYIHDEIIEMPGGYDAEVRELGKNLSSGQRQRIAIARAILRDAPILILDEPTANLDVEAEAVVMRAVERLTEGRTVMVISHRLSTLGRVDEIAVLEGGRIAERGTYQELKALGGSFARLLAEQNRYAAEPIQLPVPAAEDGHLAGVAMRPPRAGSGDGVVIRGRRRSRGVSRADALSIGELYNLVDAAALWVTECVASLAPVGTPARITGEEELRNAREQLARARTQLAAARSRLRSGESDGHRGLPGRSQLRKKRG